MNRRRRNLGNRKSGLRGLLSALRRSPGRGGRRQTGLVGRDLAGAGRSESNRRRLIGGALVGAVLAALAVAALRVELIELGYARAAAMSREKKLLEEHRVLTAQLRAQRDPTRLSLLARKLELVRPEQVIALAPPGSERRP